MQVVTKNISLIDLYVTHKNENLEYKISLKNTDQHTHSEDPYSYDYSTVGFTMFCSRAVSLFVPRIIEDT
jgi:hypothetical protein